MAEKRKKFASAAVEAVQSLTAPEPIAPESDLMVERSGYHVGSRLGNARLIPLEKIKPDPNQPREKFDPERLADLAASIKEHGVKQPISVQYLDEDDCFIINWGERRYRAAIQAGLKEIPCVIETVEPEKRLALQLMENIQREDLSPIEKAKGLLEYKFSLGKRTKWIDIEKTIGINERRRQQLLKLLDLPEDIQQKIIKLSKKKDAKLQFTERHARALLLFEDEEKQRELFEKIIDSDCPITSDEAMRLAKRMLAKPTFQKFTFKYTDNDDLIRQLKAKLKELEAEKQ